MLFFIAIAVIGFRDVCAVYIIGVGRDAAETRCMTCIPDALSTTTSSLRTLSSAASSISNPGVSLGYPSPEEVSYMPPAPSTHPPRPSAQLSTPAKAGIIAASIFVFFLLLLVILEYTYFRRKRQDRALERTIDKVERGTEPKDSTVDESKEIMVLESRVEIVVEEEQGSGIDSWDEENQWNAGTDEGESDGDLGEWGRGRRWERGRNGMSLPRTES